MLSEVTARFGAVLVGAAALIGCYVEPYPYGDVPPYAGPTPWLDGASGSGGDGAVGAGGTEGAVPDAPAMLSQTGLFSARGVDGALALVAGVREFQPLYPLWSDAADKRRYVYLPPGAQIDTSDPDHWVIPAGTKLWKSFVNNGQLVETRLIERTGDGPDDFLFTTYFWMTADATDAVKMDPRNLLLNAAGTTHDIPNGMMCNACHGRLKDRALGFSALQLNHDLGGLNLATLVSEGWLSDPVPLDIGVPGADPATRNALGYLHANCGNCHNDSPGLALESVPAPQMLLRLSVNDQALEDTGTFRTAINQRSTASSDLSVDFRILGGNSEDSAVPFRMGLRLIEDQMPPIGTEIVDPDGLALLEAWIQTLPPPAP